MQLDRLTAAEAAALIRSGAVTSDAFVGALLARIAERDADVAAWAHLDRELALAEARAADLKQRSGAPLGPLHGMPVGIKDIIDTATLPTENGSAIFAGRRPAEDASVVTQLRAAGAVILGKTVTTELAFYGPGKTRNPHNPAHTPGGSSSGSAAAVADFQVPLALGTQTAGSILRPASYCGVLGFKPTFGVVSRAGVLEQSSPLDTIGGYARSIEDIALLIDAMSGADARDVGMGPRFSAPLTEALKQGTARSPRFAFVKTAVWPQGEDSMKSGFEDLAASLGAAVEEVSLPPSFDVMTGLQRAVQFHDIARSYGPINEAHPGKLSAKLVEVIGIGKGVTEQEYTSALALREPLGEDLRPIFETYDAILTPAAAGPAPEGLSSTGSPVFNFLWTYLGLPAISLPLLEVGGLPLGVQLVGAKDEDGKLLAVAQHLMRALKPSR
jgi:Asp-tRNA(Asn)/Glu-tRNA(Gln) amidotransferase A subunit family amidase